MLDLNSLAIFFPHWPDLEPLSLTEPCKVFACLACLFILGANLPVLWILKKKFEPTAINIFIVINCVINILNISGVLLMVLDLDFEKGPLLCSLGTTAVFLFSLLNRLLSVGIVAFRYVYVCQSHLVSTAEQRKKFSRNLVNSTICIPLLLSVFSLLYKDKYLHYLKCLGR